MKRVMDGKVYDTEKAELMHRHETDEDGLYGIDEGLYVTAKGAYFTAGSGGACTTYAVRESSTTTSGGSGIRVLDREAAIEWLERHGGTEALMEHFADALEEA